MELTKEQIEFLDRVCIGKDNWKLNFDGEVDVDGSVDVRNMNLTEIPVKFGSVSGSFYCHSSCITTLKNIPNYIGGGFSFSLKGSLIDYLKNIKEEDFKFWHKLLWDDALKEYPFLINICKKYRTKNNLKEYLDAYPLTKIYLE